MQSSVVAVGATGLMVSPDGYVLTCAHGGLKPGIVLPMTFSDGSKLEGKRLGADDGQDVALFKATATGDLPFVDFGKPVPLRAGQWVVSVGYPRPVEHGKPPLVRLGHIVGYNPWWLAVDSLFAPGDSGGPLFDLEGRLVGTCRGDARPYAVFTNVNAFRSSWRTLVDDKGVASLASGEALLGVLPKVNTQAAEVGEIVVSSPAETAGIRPGDVIMRIDGQPVEQFADLLDPLRRKNPGDKIQVELCRADETIHVAITLGQSNPQSDILKPMFDSYEWFWRYCDDDVSRNNHRAIKAAFRSTVAPARLATVSIVIDDKPVGLGAVVDAEGLIVTKASFLNENIQCRFSDGRSMKATVVGSSDIYDLALLKVEASDLPVVQWRTDAPPPAGSLLAAVGAQKDPLAVGVAGALPRTVPGVLSANVALSEKGVLRVIGVEAASAAERAGLRSDDVIVTVGGAQVQSTEQWRQILDTHQRGTPLELVITRGDDRPQRLQISVPRFGSPAAILHDAMVRANESGGPLVDLGGEVVAINVADRQSRLSENNIATNIAVPAAAVQRIVGELRAKDQEASRKIRDVEATFFSGARGQGRPPLAKYFVHRPCHGESLRYTD
ncbi:MAG: trypsin-like peptidase domain-containing protein [Planctomycetales bacterium]